MVHGDVNDPVEMERVIKRFQNDEKISEKSLKMLENNEYFQRVLIKNTTVIKNCLLFFKWLTIIGFGIAIISGILELS